MSAQALAVSAARSGSGDRARKVMIEGDTRPARSPVSIVTSSSLPAATSASVRNRVEARKSASADIWRPATSAVPSGNSWADDSVRISTVASEA